MSENLDSVMRRIAKLLAIAQDDRANPSEAAAAAGMAERIMRKYQIENSDLIMTQLKAGDSMGEADSMATAKTNGTPVVKVPPWCSMMAVQVARVNDVNVRIVRLPDGQVAIRFQGFKSDVQIAKYMFDYLTATINRLCKQFLKTEEYLVGGRPVVNSYRLGVTNGVMSSLMKMCKEKEAEQQTLSKGRELVLCKAQAVSTHFGEQRTRPVNSSVRRGDSFTQGFSDGRKVNVSQRGITSSAGSNTLSLGC